MGVKGEENIDDRRRMPSHCLASDELLCCPERQGVSSSRLAGFTSRFLSCPIASRSNKTQLVTSRIGIATMPKVTFRATVLYPGGRLFRLSIGVVLGKWLLSNGLPIMLKGSRPLWAFNRALRYSTLCCRLLDPSNITRKKPSRENQIKCSSARKL